MKTQVIETWASFWDLEPEWNDLLTHSRADALFLRWEWVSTWARIACHSVQPIIISVRDDSGQLAGLAPMYRTRFVLGTLIPYRVLRMMGDHATGAEYPDWIVRSDSEGEVASAIAQALSELRGQWDCLWMPNVAGWTDAYERISEACRQHNLRMHVRQRTFALVQLPQDLSAYIRSLSKHKRQLLRTETHKVFARSEVGIASCSTPSELPRFLDALFDLHYRRHSEQGDDGAFRRKPAEAEFYRQFAPVALQLGWLRLFGLEECGALRAVQIGYVYRNVFHAMQEGFDPLYLKGAGHVLRAKVIEHSILEGVTAYDFLGDMTDHKRRWLATERFGYDLFIAAPHMKARLLFLREVWPTGRFLRPIASNTDTDIASPVHSVSSERGPSALDSVSWSADILPIPSNHAPAPNGGQRGRASRTRSVAPNRCALGAT